MIPLPNFVRLIAFCVAFDVLLVLAVLRAVRHG